MLSCDASDLSRDAICLVGFSPPQSQAIRIALLCAYLNGTTMNCDPDTLADAAKCYVGIPPAFRDAIEIYLLCQLVNGGSGSVQVLTTSDINPNTASIVPDDQTKAAFWYQIPSDGSGTNLWTWDTNLLSWNQVIA